MKEQKRINKRKVATASMAIIGVGLVVGGAFAALSDTLNHNETVVIEWVDIVDGSGSNLALEDVSDVTNTPVDELTPGKTYELTGTLENDSTVVTNWSVTDLTNVPGMTVTIADSDGVDTPTAVGEDIDVAQFGITVEVDQSITPSTGLNFVIEFSSTDARTDIPTLDEPTAISEVFIDPALATCVANDDELVAITGGDVNYSITQADLNSVMNLDCGASGVVNIEGIQYLTNVNTLYLYGNEISDLTPLSNLYNVTELILYDNNISDLTSLTNMTSLTVLNVHTNSISDITPLTGLTNLEYLDLGVNEITDITALTNLTNLEFLSLSNNTVTDITPITNLVNLTYLNLNENQVTNIDAIAGLNNLVTLYLNNNQISDFSSLTYKPANLYASNQSVTLADITHTTPTTVTIAGVNDEALNITFNTPGTYTSGQLTWANPGQNTLTYASSDGKITGTITQYVSIAPTAISVLFTDPALAACVASDDDSPAAGNVNYIITQEELNNFDDLKCDRLGINSLEGVQYMTGLTNLSAMYNNISDLTPLTYLTNLTHLSLEDNQISNLTPLKNLNNLLLLNLYNNNIVDVTPLANLTNLVILNVGVNQVSDITALANLVNLEILYLASNQISDITPLSGLTNLVELNLSSNYISDFSPLTYQPATFNAQNQYIDLPTVYWQTPTPITIAGVNNEPLILTWITGGVYENGQITWDYGNKENSLTFTSADGKISGTVTQWVNMNP